MLEIEQQQQNEEDEQMSQEQTSQQQLSQLPPSSLLPDIMTASKCSEEAVVRHVEAQDTVTNKIAAQEIVTPSLGHEPTVKDCELQSEVIAVKATVSLGSNGNCLGVSTVTAPPENDTEEFVSNGHVTISEQQLYPEPKVQVGEVI